MNEMISLFILLMKQHRLGFDGLSGIDVETDENRMDGEEDRSLWEK